ncbi:hypothetical protein I4U23_013153 [Adineta vaga]|nr:hypothetical protein I4U23_013153 [Adineta vaga]
MSRKYTSWASNQLSINPDLSAMMRLSTVSGNEQDQLKNFERVEAIPHMYINVDAPPPPTTKFDGRAIQPTLIQNSQASYFAAPNVMVPPSNVQTKIWPIEKPAKNTSIFESGSSTSKRPHKHKHHHHHHGEKHHHHRHHSRRHRAKSAESIRNRQHPSSLSTSKLMLANSQYLDQDQQQQQQQQQPMIVYREVANGDGYSVDPNTFASVPYGTETAVADDQQAPMVVYRDANFSQPQQHQSVISDGLSQDIFYNQDQDGVIQQTADPFFCLPQQQQQQQSSQIVYCTDSNQQDYMCASNNNNIIQQVVTPQQHQQHQQQQFVCVDNSSSTMQPTIINQIPVFNPLATAQSSQSIISMPQTSLQRATSVLIQQQPQHQPLQIIQQPQPLQVIQQPQPLQLIQQPQQLQFIPNQQAQTGQYLQIASATPQIIQTIQPQVIQNPSVLQTIQVPAQTVAASPQILYQRPYDPVMVPIQNQQLAIANSPVVSLSQPSYAPARIASTLAGGQSQGPNMFRHALLQTVAGRTGVPLPAAQPVSGGGAIQLMQPTVTSPIASNAK